MLQCSRTMAALLQGAALSPMVVGASQAHAQARVQFDMAMPAQPLGKALKALALLSGKTVLADATLVVGKQAPAIRGSFTLEEALHRLLSGSGLRVERIDDNYVIRPGHQISDATIPGDNQSIVITGSRLRGAPIASPVIKISQEDLRASGQSSLGDVARRIPQSFGGGQNPGIGMNVPSGSGVDIGASASVNLRGLGSDATLTLLNGHRLAYTAVKQSVDISAIPANAVDRIEVVPDGASAIYGSDAVAGVVNIVLRRDYDGLETSARLGGSTGGGNFQQQYGAMIGQRWSSGGAVAVYEYGSNSAIRADQRDYAANRSPGLTLFPAMRHHSGLLSAHQQLVADLDFELDALYNIRWSTLIFPTETGGDLDVGKATLSFVDKSFGVAPSLKWMLANDWRVALVGTYGKERVDFTQIECAGSVCTDPDPSFYRNTAGSIELSADGALFRLPGGAAKLALGGGYRSIGFRRFAGTGSTVNAQHVQDSYFAFGELALPFIGADQDIGFVHRLDATAAIRYERYPGIGGIATPKIGLTWGPSADFDIKASWGRSFRAPTLYQQYQPRAAYLFPPTALGATGVPATTGAILIVGGNPDLRPERANSWSGTLALHPRALPGAQLEISYFDVVYRDRIVSPIPLLGEALSNAAHRDQLVLNPSADAQADAIASAVSFLNLTGTPYDPANVLAIVDNGNVNAGRQTARGVDMLASYVATLADGDTVSISGNIAYLSSHQKLTAGQAVRPLAGIIFNPPHWRGQLTAGWRTGPMTVTANANYAGDVSDVRSDPATTVRSMTTFDLTARYQLDALSSWLGGLDLTLSIQNIFNAAPDTIATSLPYDTPYDSTNYSPVGRFISFGIRKTW